MDLERERTQVLRRDAEWAKLGSSGHDIDRILSCWTDDARVYPPDLPVVSAGPRSEGTDAILSPDGQLAYLLSANSVTLPGPTGELVTTPGRAVTVWRKQPDGEWRCAVDIWNAAPAGA